MPPKYEPTEAESIRFWELQAEINHARYGIAKESTTSFHLASRLNRLYELMKSFIKVEN